MEQKDIPERSSRRYSEDEGRQTRRRSDDGHDDEPKPRVNRQSLLIIAVSVVLSFLIIMMWSNANLLGKKDFETNIVNIMDDMGKLQSSVSGEKDLTNTINSLSSQVSLMGDKVNNATQIVSDMQANLGNYVKADSITQVNSSLASIQNTVNTLQSQVSNIKQADTSTLQASIDSLKTLLVNMETRVTVLEQGVATGGKVSKAIQVTVKTLGQNSFYTINNLDADGDTPVGSDITPDGLQASVRLTLTNTTLFDVDDAIVDLEFSIYPLLPSYNTMAVSGGGVPWYKEYSDRENASFYNGAWGLVVPAGQSVNLNLLLTIQGTNNPSWSTSSYGGYYFQLQANAS